MARDVRKALKEIAMIVGKKNEKEAEDFITNLLNTNRYHSGKTFLLSKNF